MRILIGFLSGILGMLAGWFGLAMLIVSLSGPDRDGGTAMGAFFEIGPIGAVLGFIAGVVLFMKIGVHRTAAAPVETVPEGAAPAAKQTRISRPFAIFVLAITAELAWWDWYELIRSPYLTHGDMRLDLQFRLPAGTALPPDARDVHVDVTENEGSADPMLSDTAWHGHDGNRPVILAKASLSYKTRDRVATLSMPGLPTQTWQIDLPSDPDPTPGYTPWRPADGGGRVEMNYRLSTGN